MAKTITIKPPIAGNMGNEILVWENGKVVGTYWSPAHWTASMRGSSAVVLINPQSRQQKVVTADGLSSLGRSSWIDVSDAEGLTPGMAAATGTQAAQPSQAGPGSSFSDYTGQGTPPPPNPNDPAFQLLEDMDGDGIPETPIGIDWPGYYEAYDQWQQLSQTGGYSPENQNRPPQASPAEYIDNIIAGIQTDLDNAKLRTDQVVQEFNRRWQAFNTASETFTGLQPFTIPKGAQYVPGFEPSGFAQSIGLQPQAATPININPFEMANQLVGSSPSPMSVGTPGSTEEYINLAKSFLGQI